MMRNIQFRPLAFFGLMLFSLAFTLPADEGPLNAMPSMMVKDLQGKEIDLKSFSQQQKVTIYAFWATWCSPCKKELDNINDLLGEWKDLYDVQLVGVSIDDSRNSAKVKPYVDGKGWKFPVVIDLNNDSRRLLNVPNVPYTLVTDKDGNVVYKHSGYQEGDEFVLETKLKELTK